MNLAIYLALVVILWVIFYVLVKLASVVSAKSKSASVFYGPYGVSAACFSQEADNCPTERIR